MDFLMEIIKKYNIDLVKLMFFGITVLIVVLGSLINLAEPILPESLRQSFRYGKFAFKGNPTAVVSKMEVPKSWFKHFYVFAFVCSVLGLFLVLKGIILHTAAPEYVLSFLDFLCGGQGNRRVQLDSTRALVASVLIALQCTRRFYESNFVQIFNSKSKMNFQHYLVGYLHYFGVVVAVLANAEGFVRGTLPSTFSLSKLGWPQYLCILIFHFSWLQQHKSNMILVNLRKDGKTGEVTTERHLLPKGGFFELVSSPHMFFEICMYIALTGIFTATATWWYILFWVISNQTCVALLNHKWYKENFKNYPKQRRALIPFIL